MSKAVAAIIEGIRPYDSLEAEHIQDALAWVKSGEPLYRLDELNQPPKHLVSYFILFDEQEKKLLLVDHIKAGLWLPSGGHVEVDEDPHETAKRECMEELNVEADFWCDKPLFITINPTTCTHTRHLDVVLWYVLKGDCFADYQFDKGEFYGIEWFDWDNLPNRADVHLPRFVQKLKSFNKLNINLVSWGSNEYNEAVRLRERVLRTPLGLTISDQDLQLEKEDTHFGVYKQGRLIATAILKAENSKICKMKQVVVCPSMQGAGIGGQLLTFLEQHAQSSGFKRIYCHARVSAVEFYRRHQYETEGDVFEEVTIPHLKMIKNL